MYVFQSCNQHLDHNIRSRFLNLILLGNWDIVISIERTCIWVRNILVYIFNVMTSSLKIAGNLLKFSIIESLPTVILVIILLVSLLDPFLNDLVLLSLFLITFSHFPHTLTTSFSLKDCVGINFLIVITFLMVLLLDVELPLFLYSNPTS